jgi:signal peptidase I
MTWWPMAFLASAGLLAAGVIMLRRRYLVVRVNGESMIPSLRPGDRVLVRRASLRGLRAGTIILIRAWPGSGLSRVGGGRQPDAVPWLIKRLASGPGEPVPAVARAGCGNVHVVPAGKAVVLSDNLSGADSRTWGFASADQVVGYVAALPRRSRRWLCARR